ncbi:hypothetical protein G6011_02630 [Alternaria panax]|uniref:Uncharacterized protein n=1 Tax=Alternaria panax TaxID=48097 RepID=A0AAD4I7W2_9PLEO|nr:hypothetical protein G6011_02630 [Alternaria panax]
MAPPIIDGVYSGCEEAFPTAFSQANLAFNVIFTAVFVGIFVAAFFVRGKTRGGKKLVGVPFIIALFLQALSYLLFLIGIVVYECSNMSSNDYMNISIASNVIARVADWLLLVVFAYILNSMLLKQLEISSSGSKTVFQIVVGVMATVIIADLALSNYVNTSSRKWDFDFVLTLLAARAFSLTANTLWLISVTISAAFSLSNISALRSRRLPGGDLIGWLTALYIFLFIYAILEIVFSSSLFWPSKIPLSNGLSLPFSFISALSLAVTFIFLICIAKHISWSQTIQKTELEYAPVIEQQATHGDGNGQQDYYQQTPELVYSKRADDGRRGTSTVPLMYFLLHHDTFPSYTQNLYPAPNTYAICLFHY